MPYEYFLYAILAIILAIGCVLLYVQTKNPDPFKYTSKISNYDRHFKLAMILMSIALMLFAMMVAFGTRGE